MGLVRYGAGIVQVSGSIAGTVHARNRFGNYIRPRTKPVNPRSDRQEAIRTIVSYLAEYWHSDLDETQRGLWGDYAAAIAMNNRLGETIHLTGFNHFIRSNSAVLSIGETIIPDAPSILSLPEKDPDLACSEEAISTQLFTFDCDTVGWAPNGDPKLAILLYQGRPQLASRNVFFGPWRGIPYIDDTAGALGTWDAAAGFAFAVGQKVWFQARVLTVSGRLSSLWAVPPRVIEADV